MKNKDTKNFWETKKLSEMNFSEWESLCDGCGKCCLIKLEDQQGKIEYTNVACKLLNLNSCTCNDYQNRRGKVKDCVKLSPKNINEIKWMPSTCSYKLIFEGKNLPSWHHLITNDKSSIHNAHQSVKEKVIKEKSNMDFEKYIIANENSIFEN
ncbi:YcgN family cysteine cluster protein [Alphaproteobacteria bacterium]|nr:YcgN family cysteine cluster protein [Alphaproteobacteria bacterium]